MSRIRPFRALRYDPARVSLERVIAPPYDVIPDAERAEWYERDAHNAVRLELTRDVAEQSTTDYGQVAQTLGAWQEQGVLRRDERPGLYGLRQRFRTRDGAEHVRESFFGLLHLEDFSSGLVRPHEHTLRGPKADRLKVIRATRANLSSIFLLYEDREQQVARALASAFDGPGVLEVPDAAGAVHELVAVDDPARIGELVGHLAERPLVIADGHHRYETALAYRDECRAAGRVDPDAPSEWILACFANAFAPGTLLLPIHRLIRKGSLPRVDAWDECLPGWSSTLVPVDSADEIPELLARHLAPLRGSHAFAVDDASGTLRILSRPADGELGVRVIHREVIEGVFGLDESAVRDGAIDYPKDAVQTARELRQGRGLAALYLNPLTPDDVFRVTAAGERMPQKSTFFHPKLPTGLVFRTFEEPG